MSYLLPQGHPAGGALQFFRHHLTHPVSFGQRMARLNPQSEPLAGSLTHPACHDLLNIGRFDAEAGCFSPSDAAWAIKRLGATCGPVCFAAACRTPVSSAIRFFSGFPRRNWTTIGDMRNALQMARIPFAERGTTLPDYGLALLQLRVNDAPLHGLYSLRQTHWVAVSGGCFYDLNWLGWLPIDLWQELVLSRFSFSGKPVRSWETRNAIEILDEELVGAALGHTQTKADRLAGAVCRMAATAQNFPSSNRGQLDDRANAL